MDFHRPPHPPRPRLHPCRLHHLTSIFDLDVRRARRGFGNNYNQEMYKTVRLTEYEDLLVWIGYRTATLSLEIQLHQSKLSNQRRFWELDNVTALLEKSRNGNNAVYQMVLTIPIDHFMNNFSQPYWEQSGLVFLQEYHDASCQKNTKDSQFSENTDFMAASLPFPVNLDENTTADQWRFLNTEQALEDSATVIRGLEPLLRIQNLSTILASCASFAPVQAQVDMASYYKAAERSLTRNYSVDWIQVTRLSEPEANTTGTNNLTTAVANQTSNVDAAGILMSPLDFHQLHTNLLLDLLGCLFITRLNGYYGGCNMNPSNMMFSNGEWLNQRFIMVMDDDVEYV
ncbi:hypothetical protein BYT27DRAFT_7218407 [Phlegmacium glaucopus]|nr:hypothetical protein BYT27DRAFT_7218407 [Phlegmacium glaucopus]